VSVNIKSYQKWWSQYSDSGFLAVRPQSVPTGRCENSLSINLKIEKQQQTTAAKTSSYHTLCHTKHCQLKIQNMTITSKLAIHIHSDWSAYMSIFCSSGCTTAIVFLFYCSVTSGHLFYSCFSMQTVVVFFPVVHRQLSGMLSMARSNMIDVVCKITHSPLTIPELKCYQKSKLYLHLQNQC